MKKFSVLLKKDLVSIIRTKKFLIILLVLISFAILSPISAKLVGLLLNILGDQLGNQFEQINELAKLLGGASFVDSYAQFAGNLAEMFVFVLIVLFGGSIIKEKTKGTYHILKMNGVDDRAFIMSHVVSQIIMVSISYIISCVVFIITTFILFGHAIPVHAFYSLFSLYLLIIFFVILMNFISCYSKSNTMCMILNFSAYFGIVLINMFGKIKWFFPFSLNDNSIFVLNGDITVNNNIAIFTTIAWSLIMIIVMMVYRKNNVKND